MATSFNFNAFKNGKIAINGLGREVRFIAESRDKMVVAVKGIFGKEETTKMNIDGSKYAGAKTPYDLVEMKDAA